jgi:hypothetical protein
MIGDSLSPLKDACYTALTGTSGFMALLTGFFDDQAPTSQPFNYVVMGACTQLAQNTMGKGGRECTIIFDIFTQGNTLGSQAGMAISDTLYRALIQQPLPLVTTPAQACTYIDFDNYSDQMEGDAIPVYHGMARILFRTQEV